MVTTASAETLIAAEELSPEDERPFLNVILSEAGRLDRTIDNLLNISHMQGRRNDTGSS